MSDTDYDDERRTEIASVPDAEDDEEDTELLDRIKDNPRPAKLWLAGLGVLVLLEIGRILSGMATILGTAAFVFDGVGRIPFWVGGNFADAFGALPVLELVADYFGVFVTGFVAFLMTYLLVVILAAIRPLKKLSFAVSAIGAALQLGIVSRVKSLVSTVSPSGIVARLKSAWGAIRRPRLVERFLERRDVTVTARRRRHAHWLDLTVGVFAIGVVLVVTPLSGLIRAELSLLLLLFDAIASLVPSITSRELIPNQGHRTPGGGWEGTFMGLSPAQAWALRVSLVVAYVVALMYWLLRGYNVFRRHYRQADWTPRDDTLKRFRTNYWGIFGLVVVVSFFVLAAWAPAVSPVTAEENIYEPYQNDIEYFDEETETIETTTHGSANLNSQSDGVETVGPHSYDDFDRYAPLGTTERGQDMMTHLAYGARTSLVIGLTAIGLGGAIAVVLSLLTAYYKGIIDIATILASDTIIAIPALLLVMMISMLFRDGDHFLADPLDGGLLLALIFAFVYWPGLWRSIRGPSLQVAEQEWVDAAKSYGQTPAKTMQKHMAPYIAGYIMIYASLLLGSVIIFTAALTFLGLGINAPTPEWGRLIDSGQDYIATGSWHVATIPGVAIALVVMGFNALGDGIRDAIDPQADLGEEETGGVAAGGGG